MTVDEVRTRIRRWLQEAIGMEGAEYLLDRPPGGWSDLATKSDVDALESRMDQRLGAVDRRFAEVNRRFDQIDRQFSDLSVRLGEKIDSAVNRAFASQTRWLFGAIGAATALIAVIVKL